MPFTISDEMLKQAGLGEQDARVEIACRLYDAERLSLHQAARWAGLDRTGIETALLSRGLPIYRITEQDLKDDLDAIRRMEQLKNAGHL